MKCPICSEFDEADNFSCQNCNRDNLCGSHYDFDFLVCSNCAAKMRPAAEKKVAKKKAETAVATDKAAIIYGIAPTATTPIIMLNMKISPVQTFLKIAGKWALHISCYRPEDIHLSFFGLNCFLYSNFISSAVLG